MSSLSPLAQDKHQISPEVVQSIKIYSLPWNLLTRSRLSANQVRQMSIATFQTEYDPLIEEILNVLNDATCHQLPDIGTRDPRKVADITYRNGEVITALFDKAGFWFEGSDISCSLDNNDLMAINVIFF